MKSADPQGQRFSWRSHRSGRQTRSEVICLTPSRFRLLYNCRASRLSSCFAAKRLAFFGCSFAVDFDVPEETIENAESFLKTARQRKKVFSLDT